MVPPCIPRLRAGASVALRVVLPLCLWAITAAPQPAGAAGGGALFVTSDRGGKIGERSQYIRALAASGQRVEIVGECLSACTMYLELPNTCVAPSAVFGFHGPSRYGKTLPPREFEHWSQVMSRGYREPLRSWYLTTARYETQGYFRLSGAELIAMGYARC